MNIIIFLCILIYIIWFNLHDYFNLKENLENINCIGGWLPWQKTGKKTNCGSISKPKWVDNERRTYKIIKHVNADAGGIDCEKDDGDTEDISCNKPKPDDCLVIRARYYGSQSPTEEVKKETQATIRDETFAVTTTSSVTVNLNRKFSSHQHYLLH